jgi:hypothetical protein
VPLVVEGHDPFGEARQVGHDEANAGIKLDLGHDAVRHPPALRPVAEAGAVPSDLDGRAADGAPPLLDMVIVQVLPESVSMISILLPLCA